MHWSSPDLVAGDCPLSRTLHIIGGKWNAMIIRELLRGPRRFAQIRAAIGPISAKILAERLRLLADYDIVARIVSGESAAYTLTQRGQSLRPVLLALFQWGLADQRSWTSPETIRDLASRSVEVVPRTGRGGECPPRPVRGSATWRGRPAVPR